MNVQTEFHEIRVKIEVARGLQSWATLRENSDNRELHKQMYLYC